MKSQDTLFEGNSHVVRWVFLTLVLLKVVFLKIITLEPGKKQNGTKKFLESFKKKICSNTSICSIVIVIFYQNATKWKIKWLPHSIYKRVSTCTQFAANCRQNCQLRWQILGLKKHYPARQYHIGRPCEYPNSQDDGYHLCQGYFNLDM